MYLIKGIRIEEDGFIVDGFKIDRREKYHLLLKKIDKIYLENKKDFLEKIAENNVKQTQRNKARIARERKEFEKIQESIILEKYNRFRWPKMLDLHKLNQLYMQDAKGIQDDFLVDEIGMTLYLRCKYGKEDMERMEKYIIRCHNCDNEIKGNGDFRQCSCGYQYSYKEYRRSFSKNNMPTGAAAKTFEIFIQKWNIAKTYNEKNILIDHLLHEFHLSLTSGAVHRPVAMNFIDGTRKQVETIINNLARKS
ncbi:MAG: hypothetical protein PUC65_03115 [Clostridiales bacterium]|nr:hypothetical protein [Clostridiales bacterium]